MATEKVPARPTGTLTVRPPAVLKVTVPRRGRSPGWSPPGRTGPPSLRNLPVTAVVPVTVVVPVTAVVPVPVPTVPVVAAPVPAALVSMVPAAPPAPVVPPQAASSSTARAPAPAVSRFMVSSPVGDDPWTWPKRRGFPGRALAQGAGR